MNKTQALVKFRGPAITLLDFLLLTGYCYFIYWLSDQPSLPNPMLFPHQDKLFHGGAYFIMGLLAWRFFKHYLKRPLTLAMVSLIFCALYGFSDEWHQSFVPGRSAEFADWLADSIGAAIGIIILHGLPQIRSTARKPHQPSHKMGDF